MEKTTSAIAQFIDAKREMRTQMAEANHLAEKATADFLERFGGIILTCSPVQFEELLLSDELDEHDREYAINCRLEALQEGICVYQCTAQAAPVKAGESKSESGTCKCKCASEDRDDERQLRMLGIILG